MAPKRRSKGLQAALQRSCAKTRLCKYLQSAAGCHQAERCTFAHTEEELRATPDLSYTRVCRLYRAGVCEAGADCSFAHGESALRKLPQPEAVDIIEPSSYDATSSTDGRAQADGSARARFLPSIPYRLMGLT
eukprot:TRINITY_DN20772_c0_g1_i5.p1 TRINITY_DN20772_c0_g1~~TRINITY_DN20772_c0_g1_i5.p1  ORF type:complete len:133 (+),score=13.07 TRINITY_DN20772_c0_g1_i5:116-514(+)